MARSAVLCLGLWAVGARGFLEGGAPASASALGRRGQSACSSRGTSRSPSAPLGMSFADDSGSSSDAADAELEHNARKLKNLLTAQSAATALFYMQEFHDTVTPDWLAAYTENHQIDEEGWDSWLARLMRSEPEELTVHRVVQRPRGGSGNNPYLSDKRQQFEYKVLVDPHSLAKRIMGVREQVAGEWQHDLGLIELENEELQRRHVDDLELGGEEAALAANGRMVLDHDGMESTYTPFRAKNYRKLIDFTTSIATRRYQAELRIVGDRYTRSWVEKFLHKKSDLSGNELVEAMLNGTMIMINDPRRDSPRVVEPMRIGMHIMKHRAQVAKELVESLGDVAADHSWLNRIHLEYQFAATIDEDVLVERHERIGADSDDPTL
jgi:hypothetical protein